MQYKRLDPEDYTVDYMSIIEPAGASADGTIVIGEFDSGTINKAGTLVEKRKYAQFANIIQGDATSNLPIGASGGYFAIKRNNFKESIHPASCRVGSNRFATGSHQVNYCEAGRVYKGAGGNYLYPDIGVILGPSTPSGVKACSEETVTVSQAHIYAGPQEFNYSTNPSFLNSDGYIRFPNWGDNPVTFITTIGFYNDNGDCLAVAKLPSPSRKDFHTAFSAKVQFKF